MITVEENIYSNLYDEDGKRISNKGEWYSNIITDYCNGNGIANTMVQTAIASMVEKPFAEAYELVLKIGINEWVKHNLGYFGIEHIIRHTHIGNYSNNGIADPSDLIHIKYADTQLTIFSLVQLCIKEGYKFGVAKEEDFSKLGIGDKDEIWLGLYGHSSILYVEFDGIAFAIPWDIDPYLSDWAEAYRYDASSLDLPPIPTDTQDVVVGDILPRLEEKLDEKLTEWNVR